MGLPFLSILTFLPVLGGLFILAVGDENKKIESQNARNLALFISTVVLGLCIWMMTAFDASFNGYQFVEEYIWIESLQVRYHMGIDGISLPFIFLTALLTPICILLSWNNVTESVRGYMAAFLMLEGFVIGVFCALDFMLFYILWEVMLIPMFLIIGIWGGENRVYAAIKFFLYTFIGSLLMLIAIMYLYFANGNSFDIPTMVADINLNMDEQKWLWLALFAAFAVKIPMWPFHTWLPDAHVQAPTAGSVILAGVLLKMGAYGFLRFSLPILPAASMYFTDFVMVLSVIAIIYAALVAFAQTDVKKLIAYSSVSHMGFITLGIFAATQQGVQGGILQMLNHGIVAAALFMCVGVIYDRMHTREISRFGGIAHKMPIYAALFMLFAMASVGLPGTNNFVGEFLILIGSYEKFQVYVFIACFGILLGAIYMLSLYKRMMMGEVKSIEVKALPPMNLREKISFLPLVAIVLWIGLAPQYWLNMSEVSVKQLLKGYHHYLNVEMVEKYKNGEGAE